MAHDPLARISRQASIGEQVSIGPFSVIEAGVRIGDRCRIAAHVTVKTGVTLGDDNAIEEGAVLGGAPQHLNRIPHPGPVIIGDRNVIREHVTVHQAMHADGQTRIGSECLLMVGSHVAHDCQIGDNVVLTNNVLLAGHVQVGDRAYLGGGSAVHQHCRIGRVAMVGGLARVAQDVPPFVMIDGDSSLLVGLNRVGLKRAGFSADEINLIKEAYRLYYRSGLSFNERLELLAEHFAGGAAGEFSEFFRGGSRGFVRERRSPPNVAIRPMHEAVVERREAPAPAIKRAG
ncbi:Acyl-[acyl-carrier-protein]--UDP-N-acetylglucosamine O-acyltransferase [Posidoniimonas polymericola]|uniref:Acyl-[acyl-carrier-protein]--UDP-N-acetylglucosamine O-acyltransferase n=1 Tax=Posidoniimonas polymericola TaxID=2528002 RepID=A0A5C5YIH6_9BACT|nr:acyl-ACP--UDP-N-acetylglucosamine O-acyltransferase [Posidoniimonas polymericola]TWT74659.1 Acyl-[acyl-carrier-protein]--UDP-N-acetylglucosamine O-acyltransferase [Posidoniimonas polymericola]